VPNCGDCGKPLSDNPGPNDCPSSVTHIPTCALARLRAENELLRAAIEKAPHTGLCNLVGHQCTCWKQAALAGKEQENASSQT
jgi:hypothetical protein